MGYADGITVLLGPILSRIMHLLLSFICQLRRWSKRLVGSLGGFGRNKDVVYLGHFYY